MRRFALIGAAGFVATRHMSAIRDTHNQLVLAVDKNDSVGAIDSYFPDAYFFTDFECFDRHIKNCRREQKAIDFVSICSPNYLHDSHIRFALRSGANAICEKPVVLNPQDIDPLIKIQEETGNKVNTILQLRLHPSIIKLKRRIKNEPNNKKHDVELTYITSRGKWYLHSWKGKEKKSGGIATNIGIHFFDMLHFVFGDLKYNEVHLRSDTKAAGFLEYEHARVRWFLSIDFADVPAKLRASGQRTYRSICVDGEEIEFSDGFTNLHTLIYQEILLGQGFGIEENRVAVETVAKIRTGSIYSSNEAHPLVKKTEV